MHFAKTKKSLGRSEQPSVELTSYKSDTQIVSVHTLTGSTVVPLEPNEIDARNYNPFDHRTVSHPTTNIETLIHLLKGSLGLGILSMPMAFSNAGLRFGLLATIIVGLICTYCVHILVNCAHVLCHRIRVPSLGFADIAQVAFLTGPDALQDWSRFARFICNVFLVVNMIGCCCVYNVFVGTSLKQIIDYYVEIEIDVRLYVLSLLIPLILMNMIKTLKFLAPLSMIANALMMAGVSVTLYYIFSDVPAMSVRPEIVSAQQWPMFFGTVIFALEGVGVVMSLENNMQTPQHFIGCPGVLNIGMTFVVALYCLIGFMGFLRYGDATEASITLNLPVNDILAQSVKIMIASSVFLTYALQFYVPMEIIWKNVQGKFTEHKIAAEYSIRIGLVTLTVLLAAAVPNLGPFISLIGAVCLSTLGLMFPAIIETITYWDVSGGLGALNWRLYKNALLVAFGIVGFVTGSYVSFIEIIETVFK